jgi:nucleoside-diphosphate kinase
MKKQKKQKLSTLVLFKPKALKNHGSSLMLEGLLRPSFFFGYEIAELKKLKMIRAQAEEFYAEHRGKPFYKKLVDFMSSNYIVAIRIEYSADDPDFIERFRKFVIGATDPNKAMRGTMRQMFGAKTEYAAGLPSNGVHASDSRESAKRELAFFFDGDYEC